MNRLDTVTAIPSARPPVPAPSEMIPGLAHQATGVATYTVRRPWWVRHAPTPHLGLAVGSGLASCVVAAYVILEALAGGIQ